MARYSVELSDGRTVEVTADSAREAYDKQQLMNENLAQGEEFQEQAMQPGQVGSGQAFLLGAGRETDKLLSGIQDAYYAATGDDAARADLARTQAENDAAFANVQEQAPIASAVGGILPYLAVPTAGLGTTALVSGLTGAARYGDDRLESGLTDAAVSTVPFGLGRVGRRLKPYLYDDVASSMVSRADDVGYPLTPAERTGSRSLGVIESGIESTPMIANPMHRINAAKQARINRAAAEAIGESPGPITDEVLDSAATRIGDEFEALRSVDDLPVDESYVSRLIGVQDDARTALFSDPDLSTTVDRVFDYIDDAGNLPARDYQKLTSQLKGKIRQAFRGESPDPDYADSLGRIVDALDDVAEQGMSGNALDRLQTARRHWRALQAVERGARESGDVSGPLMANYLRRTDKGGYLRGKNRSDLYETARMSKAFPRRPDSGTAGRLTITPQGLAGLAMSPVTTLGANAYAYGAPVAQGAISIANELTPTFFGAGTVGRILAGIEDEESEANVPYLYD